MKFKISFIITFLVMVNCFLAKANDINPNHKFSSYAKITTIDAALNKAKSHEEIKAVVDKMEEIVFKKLNDTCPPPKAGSFRSICADITSRAKAPLSEIEYYEYNYEKRLLEMACINIKIDNEETVIKKLQTFWNKYKTNCKCDAIGFGIQNGSILKFALAQNMPEVIETLASTYKLDINFIDPSDGLNLLDYIISEIERLKKQQNSESTVIVYERYKASVIGLGGKSNKK